MRLAIVLGALVCLDLALAFVLPWYVVGRLGAGSQTDAFFASMAFPQFLLAIASPATAHSLFPILATEKKELLQAEAWNFLHAAGVITGPLTIALIATSGEWVPWLVPGFAPSTQALTLSLSRIQLLALPGLVLGAVLQAVCRAQRRFIWVEISNVAAGLVGLLFLVWSMARYGILGAAWVAVVRSTVQVLCLLPSMGWYRSPRWGTPGMVEVARRMRPLLAGGLFYKTTILADRFLASLAPAGALSVLYLAQQIYGALEQVLGRAVSTPTVFSLARRAHAEDWVRFTALYRRRLRQVGTLVGLCFLVVLIAGHPALQMVAGLSNITDGDARLLWVVLIALGGQLILSPLLLVLGSSFYAEGDTLVPTLIGAAVVPFGLGSRALGVYAFGVVGLALGVTLHYVLVFLVNVRVRARRAVGAVNTTIGEHADSSGPGSARS